MVPLAELYRSLTATWKLRLVRVVGSTKDVYASGGIGTVPFNDTRVRENSGGSSCRLCSQPLRYRKKFSAEPGLSVVLDHTLASYYSQFLRTMLASYLKCKVWRIRSAWYNRHRILQSGDPSHAGKGASARHTWSAIRTCKPVKQSPARELILICSSRAQNQNCWLPLEAQSYLVGQAM